MKSFKLAIITAILALGIAAPIAGAADGDGSAKAKQARNNFATAALQGITLTDAQQKQVNAIVADTQKKVNAIPQEERKGAKGRAVQNEGRAKIREVLNDEQKAIFDKNIAPRGGKSGGDKADGKKNREKKAKSSGNE